MNTRGFSLTPNLYLLLNPLLLAPSLFTFLAHLYPIFPSITSVPLPVASDPTTPVFSLLGLQLLLADPHQILQPAQLLQLPRHSPSV